MLIGRLQLLVARLRFAQLADDLAALRLEVLLRQLGCLGGGAVPDDLGLEARHVGL